MIIDLLIVLGLLVLAFLALSKEGYRKSSNRLFALFTLFVAVWIFSNHISNDVTLSPQTALHADYFVFSSSFGTLILFMMYIGRLVNAPRISKLLKAILIPMWAICLLGATPFIVAGVKRQGDVYAVLFGPLIYIYAAALFVMVAMIVYALLYGLRTTKYRERNQLEVISLSVLTCLPVIILFSFILPSLAGMFMLTEFGISPLIVLVIGLYYSVVKHNLFDIKLAAVRGLVYVGSLFVLSVIYFALAYFVSITLFQGKVSTSFSVHPINICLALLLAFIFQPIKKFFDHMTNHFFYRDQYNSEEFFANLSRQLTVTNDLHNLLTRAVHEVSNTLKSSFGAVELRINADSSFSVSTNRMRRIPVQDMIALDEYADSQKSQKVVVTESLPNKSPLQRILLSHKVALALPLMKDNKIIGYLFLGEHRNGVYTKHDIMALEAISDELVIAIQHALSVQEVKELNATLQQRIDEATKELRATNAQLQRLDEAKDEFVSMASHQLRTPLTSVKGYISMLLEGDAGQINDTQKHFLGEAFTSSERMVHLINDFLNVSRLQTGKFVIDRRLINLKTITEQEVESLRTTAKQRQLTLKLKAGARIPMLYLDENKIRQVIMNFIDNALYYSTAGTTIIIELKVEDGKVALTVKDTGIGVPESEQAHLFTKFYRASNARKQRPDGTGVGLFLAKKVIVSHGGSMIFSSEEGKGSTFGFLLPIDKLKRAPADDADNLDH